MSDNNGSKSLLVIINDYLSARIFFETDIFSGLASRSPYRVVSILNNQNIDLESLQNKYERVKFIPITHVTERDRLSLKDRFLSYVDYWMDKKFGFFPLCLRFNIKHGFQKGRRTYGNRNAFMDLSRIGPLPQWDMFYDMMFKWYFYSELHFVHPAFKQLCVEENVAGILVSNAQHPQNAPFYQAARKLEIPIASYIASWDHPVGKGPLVPHAKLYIAQNDISRQNMIKYHAIDSQKIAVTGWPQMDQYTQNNQAGKFHELLKTYGLPADKPCVLLAGCTENNAPFEPEQFEKILDWSQSGGANDDISFIFRPHPKEFGWKERYKGLMGKKNLYIQEKTFSHMDELALILGNVSCVVCTAGTILLDSIANDRPIVAIAYDEDDSKGGRHTEKNYINDHYKEIMKFKPFYLSRNHQEVIDGIKRSLTNPDEFSEKRANVRDNLIGTVDGNAGSRVVDAVLECLS